MKIIGLLSRFLLRITVICVKHMVGASNSLEKSGMYTAKGILLMASRQKKIDRGSASIGYFVTKNAGLTLSKLEAPGRNPIKKSGFPAHKRLFNERVMLSIFSGAHTPNLLARGLA